MAAQPSSNSNLEVAHILFVDVLGYSKLLTNEQAALVARLNEIVRETEQFSAAKANDGLISLPTGDGVALVFFQSPEAPMQCAIEIARKLRAHPEMRVRMGIHSGPVEVVADPDGRKNIAGAELNLARRLTVCTDAGQILLSQRVAGDEFGKAEPPSAIREQKREPSTEVTESKATRNRRRLIAGLLLLPVVIGTILSIHRLEREPPSPAESPFTPEKSIAVLPFDNFSDDNQNAYFAEGIQDDILTALAKVSDLKVISRSSVMQYRGKHKNLRQIGEMLGVAYLLEGSVRRYADKIRITAQLIDARTDVHTWAEYYDRKLSDVFAIQSEVAEKIANELKANLSATERAAIKAQPTYDLVAFEAYLQAKQLFNNFHDSPNWKETLLSALRFLDQATARDPNFALGYCLAAQTHDALYWYGVDRTPERLAQAKAMAQKALTLGPDLGEAHLVQALIHYHGNRDYARAREELAIARRVLPNSAEMYSLSGWIDRRQGRWSDAIKNEEKAVELDPQNSQFLNSLSILYDILRRYDEEEAVFARSIAANPKSADYFNLLRAQVELEKGETQNARELLNSLPANYDPDGAATSTRINLALYEGDPAGAAKILAATGHEELVGNNGLLLPRVWFEGLIARAQGDSVKTRDAFTNAHSKIWDKLRDNADDALLVAVAGVIDAALGRKAEAVADGLHAVELRPLSQDAVDGASVITTLALIYTWTGNIDSALQQLTRSATIPGGIDYGQLKYDPAWSALRNDPRYASILEGLRVTSMPRQPTATR